MLKPNVLKLSSVALLASVLVLTSCKEDEEPDRITLQDTADLTDEAMTDAYFQDIDDMAGVAIESPDDTQYSTGRVSGTITIEDPRFCEGAVVTITPAENSTLDNPKGVLTVDFGTAGCTDSRNNVRKGKLIFTYNGKRFMPGSTVVTTTENYSINGIKLEGVRTLTNLQTSTSDAPRFNVVLSDGKATFENALTATRESDITLQWNREANPLDDNLRIEDTSEASGVTRLGRTYEVDVVEALVYKRNCGIPVSGVKTYLINGEKEITVDYGDGECDRAFTITVNGVTRNISF